MEERGRVVLMRGVMMRGRVLSITDGWPVEETKAHTSTSLPGL